MTDVPVYRPAVTRSSALKRAVDLAGAVVGLTIGLPALALLAFGVRLAAGAPILHTQPRVGRRGRVFKLYKFRTLPLDSSTWADKEWSAQAEHAFLRWLRRTGLDETPQLWNVLKGEMSLVGPRPERPFFVDKFAGELPHYRLRLEGRPGITGWAQVHGLRGDTSIAKRLAYDLEYLRMRSLRLDMRILALTAIGFLRDVLYRSSNETSRKTWPTRSTSSIF